MGLHYQTLDIIDNLSCNVDLESRPHMQKAVPVLL